MNVIESDKPTAPGLYRMSADVYHADPCHEPSLSSSILRTLLDESPKHAAFEHPRLTSAKQERDATKGQDAGSAIHKIVLGYGNQIHIVQADNWRTKAAQESRDEARASGLIPMLPHEHEAAKAAASEMTRALQDMLPCPIAECHREVVMVWQENGMWRRGMVDLVTPDLRLFVDLKSTEGSVSADKCSRKVFDMGYHIQEAFYMRGADVLDHDGAGRREFVFLFGEQKAPHAVSSPIIVSESGKTLARSQVEAGCALWDSCLSRNYWPGFSNYAHHAEPPPWEISRWEARQQDDEMLNPHKWDAKELYEDKQP